MKLITILVLIALTSGAFGKFRSPWIVAPTKINLYDIDAIKNDPAFSGKTNDALFKTVHDSFANGKFLHYSDQNHTYHFHYGDNNPFEPASSSTYDYDGVWDPIKYLNVYGFGFCGFASALLEGLAEGMGYEARRYAIDNPGHSIAEVYYNSGWHYFDLDLYGWGADAGGSVYSLDWIGQNPSAYMALPANQHSNPFFSQDPGIATSIAYNYNNSTWYTFHDCAQLIHDMSMTLRQGEYIIRYWDIENEANMLSGRSYQIPEPNGVPAWGEGAVVYQPCLVSGSTDFTDGVYSSSGIVQDANGLFAASGGSVVFAVNVPYIISRFFLTETHSGTVTMQASKDMGATWSTITAGEISALKGIYNFLVRFNLSAEATLRTMRCETIFNWNPGTFPMLRAGGNSMRLYKYDSTEVLTYYSGSYTWGQTLTFNAPTGGTISAVSANIRYQRSVPASTGDQFDIKIGNSAASLVQATTAEQNVYNTFNRIQHGCQNMNAVKYPLPANSTQACVQFNQLAGWGNPMNVTVRCYYKTAAAAPSPILVTHCYTTSSGDIEQVATVNPADFGANTYATYAINATGLLANHWVKMAVASDLPADPVNPAAVTTLAVTGTGSRTVSLTWTATGDDSVTGTASQYDVRYSTAPINESNWASASQAGGEPGPAAPGAVEQFVVTNLNPSTTYYFAVKVLDETNNASGLSNVVFGTTSASTTVTITTGIDAETWPLNKTWNKGSCTMADIKPFDDTDEAEYLLKFDLASIPANATIANATVFIYVVNADAGAQTDVFKMLVPWTPGTSCDADNVCNFNYRQSGVAWGGSHGPLAGTDYNATSAGTTTLSASGYAQWNITSFVQDWANNQAANHGMIFSGREGLTWVNPQIYTLDNGANRPYLTVEYSTAAMEEIASASGPLAISACPNPFNPSTKIAVSGQQVAGSKNISIYIYNVHGTLVQILPTAGCKLPAGIMWDASGQPSGVYLVYLKAGNVQISKKITLIK